MDWIVSQAESGLKLQAFLKSKLPPTIPARQIKRAVDTGHCLINGKVERFSSKMVGYGDRISCEEIKSEPAKAERDTTDRLLYIDTDLIAYNKPAGVSSEDPKIPFALKKYSANLILLHRLDRDTTGVLLFATNEKAAEAVLELFKQRQLKKTYQAIVDGVPKTQSGVVDNYLGKLSVYQGQTLWGEMSKEKGGLRARTQWQLENAQDKASLLTCYPETGRTHQIRVHLSGIGHPILGDFQYGRAFKCAYRPKRFLLHAAELAFEHPMKKQPLVIKAPIPQDFKEAMDALHL